MARREGMVGVFEQAVSERIELNLRNGNEGPFLQLPQSSLVPHEARVSAERRRGFCSGVDEKSEQPDAGAFRLLYEARSGPFLGDESQDLGQELLVDLRHEIRVDLDDPHLVILLGRVDLFSAFGREFVEAFARVRRVLGVLLLDLSLDLGVLVGREAIVEGRRVQYVESRALQYAGCFQMRMSVRACDCLAAP